MFNDQFVRCMISRLWHWPRHILQSSVLHLIPFLHLLLLLYLFSIVLSALLFTHFQLSGFILYRTSKLYDPPAFFSPWYVYEHTLCLKQSRFPNMRAWYYAKRSVTATTYCTVRISLPGSRSDYIAAIVAGRCSFLSALKNNFTFVQFF